VSHAQDARATLARQHKTTIEARAQLLALLVFYSISQRNFQVAHKRFLLQYRRRLRLLIFFRIRILRQLT
jgi:hypothetical protein